MLLLKSTSCRIPKHHAHRGNRLGELGHLHSNTGSENVRNRFTSEPLPRRSNQTHAEDKPRIGPSIIVHTNRLCDLSILHAPYLKRLRLSSVDADALSNHSPMWPTHGRRNGSVASPNFARFNETLGPKKDEGISLNQPIVTVPDELSEFKATLTQCTSWVNYSSSNGWFVLKEAFPTA